jgi:hypothetical protein
MLQMLQYEFVEPNSCALEQYATTAARSTVNSTGLSDPQRCCCCDTLLLVLAMRTSSDMHL